VVAQEVRVEGLAPIATPAARILILGSMPGVASLQAQQYYAHPRNAFWPIMGDLFGAGLELTYAQRTKRLRDCGVAVWDVLRSCVRLGSLDSSIGDEVSNDFAVFFAKHRKLVVIGLNGGKAVASFRKHVAPLCPQNLRTVQLPSTSPAHASLTTAKKCLAWRKALL
jgi:TDG/mug DNA glycosylase family protein